MKASGSFREAFGKLLEASGKLVGSFWEAFLEAFGNRGKPLGKPLGSFREASGKLLGASGKLPGSF